jgi:hypothetical protein
MKAQQWILGTSLLLGIGGSIFKIMHWKGANIMLLLAFTLLFMNTLFFVFRENRKSGASEFTNLLSVIALCLGITGAIFRILHWPFADFILLFGHALLFIFISWITIFQPRPKLAPLFTGTALVFFFLTVFFLNHYPLQKLNQSKHAVIENTTPHLQSNFQMAQP